MDVMLDVFDNDAEAVQGGDSDTTIKATSLVINPPHQLTHAIVDTQFN
jgi:hypothetical protein